MIRLKQIRVKENAPNFVKPHPKQESIWEKQYRDGYQKARLDQHPVPGDEILARMEGISVAQQLARSVGMGPGNEGDNGSGDEDDAWKRWKWWWLKQLVQ